MVEDVSTVAEIEAAIEKLTPEEQREVADWLNAHLFEETPAMLAALDEGIRSSREEGSKEYTQAELEQRVRKWAGGLP